MHRRDLTRALLASATGATLLAHSETSQGDPPHPQSTAERAAGVMPKNFDHPPGSVLRYGADPSGARDSSEAWRDALKANSQVFDDHPGGGSYLFASEVTISRYPVTILGSAKQIGGGTGGTIITLAATAGAGMAILRTEKFASCVRIERIRFAWQALNKSPRGLRFAELRGSRILDCAFVGDHSARNTAVGIQFDGGGTFTGDVTIRENYFSGLLRGIDLQGVCTSVRIIGNEMYGYVSEASSAAIRIASRSTETAIAFNGIEGWTTGIDSSGGYVKQIGNTYEVNGTNFKWMRGAGNDRIWNMSIGEAFVSGGQPVYPVNDTDACMVLSGPGIANFDMTSVNARRGYFAYGRVAREGDWSTEAFSAASYSAKGFASWSVASSEHATLEYTRIGHTMTVNFRIDSSQLAGQPRQLFIRLPQSEQAVRAAASTCFLKDNAGAIGKTWIAAGSGVLMLAKANDEEFNSGPFSCWGSITFECH
jgi:hypothetical protein